MKKTEFVDYTVTGVKMHGRQVYIRSEILRFVEEHRCENETLCETLMRILKIKPANDYAHKSGRPPKFALPDLMVGQTAVMSAEEIADERALYRAMRRANRRGTVYAVSYHGDSWAITRAK